MGPIVVVQLLIATLASYGFARYSGRLKNAIFFAYIIMMLMPYQVTLVPNFLVSRAIGIYGTRWAIWLPGMFSPFAVYLLTKFMRRIPTEVMEAASIDGANEWKVFFEIVMPNVKPAWMTLIIFQVQALWNNRFSMYIYSEEKKPMVFALQQIQAGGIARTGQGAAVLVVVMIVPILIFVFSESQILETMASSGIKE